MVFRLLTARGKSAVKLFPLCQWNRLEKRTVNGQHKLTRMWKYNHLNTNHNKTMFIKLGKDDTNSTFE